MMMKLIILVTLVIVHLGLVEACDPSTQSCTALNNRLDTIEETCTQLKEENEESIKNLAQRSNQLESDNAGVKENLTMVQEANVEIKENINNLTQRSKQLESDNAGLKENLTMVQEANVELKELLTVVQEANVELKENYTQLKEENEDLVAKLNNNTADLKLITDSFINLKERVDILHPVPLLKDCQELLTQGTIQSGVYDISDPTGEGSTPVYCDQQTDGGGWTVFQRRSSNSVDFYRNWIDYKEGFGDVPENYWLGLDRIHNLTAGRTVKLRVELKDFDDNQAYAEYSSFSVASSSDNYRLSISDYQGNAGDSLISVNNGMQFTTKDADHDTWSGNCADSRKGGWWYRGCSKSNLNGRYYTYAKDAGDGVVWRNWKNSWISLKETKMMIRV